MKKLSRLIFIILIGFMLFLTAACGKEIPNPYKGLAVQDFSFIDQDENTYTKENLVGKITVADFIYTSCTDICVPMTANMAKLQEMAKKENLEVQFVSFSVDPEVDTPDVLKNYANQFHADLSNWSFLTGYSQQEIEAFAKDSFKTLVQKPKDSAQVGHGTRFYLIDQNGDIIKDYSGVTDTPYEEIIEHIKILNKKG